MTPEHLAAWRKRLKLTQADAADELGASLTGFRGWEGGKHPVPGYIALAAAAIECEANPEMVTKKLRRLLLDIAARIDLFEQGSKQIEDRGDPKAKPTKIKK
jgi:transcriptional regulator with XRE-family HTH domain